MNNNLHIIYYLPKNNTIMLKYNLVARKNPQTKEPIFYAQIAPVTPLPLTALSEAISRQCTVTVHDVKAVLSALDEHITAALLNGQSVRLGDLGSFRATIKSASVKDANDFKPTHIKGINVCFTKGSTMRYKFSTKNPDLAIVMNTKPKESE